MHELEVVVALSLALAVAGWCRSRDLPAPLPVVVFGLLLGLLPVAENFAAEPRLVLTLALPPLLFGMALESSYVGIRANLRPILLLSVGLVAFTALAVAAAIHLVVPDMPWAVALVLGAVLGPPDAVAASAIGGKLGLPPRLMTILEGESLVNDGTALTIFRVAVAAALAGSMTAGRATAILLLAVVGGIGFGLAAGVAVRWLIRHLHDSLLETTAILVTPFAVFLGSEALGASGFLAVVVCGLMISHTSAAEQGFATRLQSRSLWSVFSFVLEAAAFLILGLELPVLTRAVLDAPTGIPVVGVIVAVFATVVLSRIIWVFPATYLPRRLSARVREADPAPSWRGVAVVAWAGIRGPVSLLAALGIPLTVDGGAPFPYRDLLLLVTGVVVLLTLIIQGLTLGPLIRALGVRATDQSADILAEAEAQHHAARAGLTALDELLAQESTDPSLTRPSEQVVDTLRASAERRANGAWERLGGDTETPSDTYRRLRLAMLEAERHVFLTYRDSGRLSDRVLRQIFRDLDLEEASLSR